MRRKEKEISVIPLKSIWYSTVGFISKNSLALNLNSTAVTWLLCPFVFFFFSFSFSSSTSPVNYRRQIRAILPKRMTCTGDGWRSVSSNSFGKAPSSVKIKGTVERFTAGRFEEEEATCVQSYHLRQGRNSRNFPLPQQLHSAAVTARGLPKLNGPPFNPLPRVARKRRRNVVR